MVSSTQNVYRFQWLVVALVGFLGTSITSGTTNASAQTLIHAPDSVRALANQAALWIQSADPKEAAWGAFVAGELKLTDTTPILVEALRRVDADASACVPSFGCDQVARTAALLEALVQLDARVDANLLGPLIARFTGPSLLLLSRSPSGRDAVLQGLLDHASGEIWYAAANMLLHTKPPGFAARILGPVRFRLNVTVTDREDVGHWGGSGGGTERSCNVAVVAPGFPPLVDYDFSVGFRSDFRAAPAPVSTLLVDGPSPVFYRRIVRAPGVLPCQHVGFDPSRPTAQDRLDYAVALAKPPKVVRPVAQRWHSLTWLGTERFLLQVEEFRGFTRGVHQSLIDALVRQRLLTDEERDRLPTILEVSVTDRRTNRAVALPPVD